MSARVYVRKFDHDDAQARYAAGETISSLAREYGVTWTAVQLAVSPEARERQREAIRRYTSKGRCDDCGGPMNQQSRCPSNGSTRCKQCAYKALAKVRDGQAYCPTCDKWKPLDQFSPSVQRKARGVHGECRSCDTARRQARRVAHKKPCVDCGQPALDPSEKTTNGSKKPRCRSCFHRWQSEWMRLPEQREAARQRALHLPDAPDRSRIRNLSLPNETSRPDR